MERFQIYLAGGCKHESDEGKGWREKVALIFNEHIESDDYKVVIIDPTKYFTYADRKDSETDRQIKCFYLDQIRHSRIVLVNLEGSDKSVGTGMEVQYAVDHNVAVIGFNGNKDGVYPWLLVDCQVIFPSMLQAIDYIKEYYIERR